MELDSTLGGVARQLNWRFRLATRRHTIAVAQLANGEKELLHCITPQGGNWSRLMVQVRGVEDGQRPARSADLLWLSDELPLAKIGLSGGENSELWALLDVPDYLVAVRTILPLAEAVSAAGSAGAGCSDWIGRVETAVEATQSALDQLDPPSDESCWGLLEDTIDVMGWGLDIEAGRLFSPKREGQVEFAVSIDRGLLTLLVAESDVPSHPATRLQGPLAATFKLMPLTFSDSSTGTLVCRATMPLAGANPLDVVEFIALVTDQHVRGWEVVERNSCRWSWRDPLR